MPDTVYDRRKYQVTSGAAAKLIVGRWLAEFDIKDVTTLGLAEVDDRYHVWRIPVLAPNGDRVGEVVVDANTSIVDTSRTASVESMLSGIAAATAAEPTVAPVARNAPYEKGPTLHQLIHGDSRGVLAGMPEGSVDLVFTSPPYYNARPEYADYASYPEYLAGIREIVRASARVLGEGRFFVMDISSVLVRRESRSTASRRIAVPFDVHQIFLEEGFDFIDHILWEKPSGAGWATGRGRRFAADRTPLQYKTVPVTEDLLVYRKKTTRLIDWNIRAYPDQDAVQRSKIADGYEATNIWRISPSNDKRHPAIFPEALAERVIRYYSFETDTVLDPYGGLGTTGRVAQRLGRGFVMIERDESYFTAMLEDVNKGKWGGLFTDPIEVKCTTSDCGNTSCMEPSKDEQ